MKLLRPCFRYFLAGCLVAFPATILAIPAKLGLRTVAQPDGTMLLIQIVGDEHSHFTLDEQGYLLMKDTDGYYKLADIGEDGVAMATGLLPSKENVSVYGRRLSDLDLELIEGKRRAKHTGIGMYDPGYPTLGSPRCLVILVEYSDVKFSEDFDEKEYFTKAMTADDFDLYGGTGSVTQYFKDQSGGKFTPVFDVYGPVTLPNTQAYYGDNRGQTWDCYAHYMVSHAAEILDDEIDFGLYDEDGDGEVDFVYIFYAGQGEHNQGGPDTVWPHSGMLLKVADFKIVDGKWLNRYACSNEMEGDVPAGIGPFIHEYSHVLGLPDLYTTLPGIESDFTCGQYSILDYGVYNNASRTPPNYTAYERNALGWNEPIMIEEPATVRLKDISTGAFGLIPTSSINEFFLLENRQLEGWDAYLPGHGLLIWHVDYNKMRFENNEVNTNRDHQLVELIKANGEESFIRYAEGFPFPGMSGNTSFTPESVPAMRAWTGEIMTLPVTDIEEDAKGRITFNVAGGGKTLTVESVNTGDNPQSVVYWNLQGIPVKKPRKGETVIEKRGEVVRKLRF